MLAKQIADAIRANTDRACALSVPLKEISETNRLLWAEAKKCDFTFRRVDAILQAISLAEMEAALRRSK